jgi:hypothetical protein
MKVKLKEIKLLKFDDRSIVSQGFYVYCPSLDKELFVNNQMKKYFGEYIEVELCSNIFALKEGYTHKQVDKCWVYHQDWFDNGDFFISKEEMEILS